VVEDVVHNIVLISTEVACVLLLALIWVFLLAAFLHQWPHAVTASAPRHLEVTVGQLLIESSLLVSIVLVRLVLQVRIFYDVSYNTESVLPVQPVTNGLAILIE